MMATRNRWSHARPCRHCHTTAMYSGRRGLCNRCYRDTDTRRLYPELDTVTPGVSISNPCRGIAPKPTYEPPGSEGKLRVLEARAAAGYDLFHPNDAADMTGATLADFPGMVVGARVVSDQGRHKGKGVRA